MEKKELQHAYFLLNGYVNDILNESIGRNYLLELQKWFLNHLEKDPIVHKIKPCHSSKFYGIDCIESEDQYGFFKSKIDVRPSSCIWVNKDKAEKLFNLFKGIKNLEQMKEKEEISKLSKN